MLVSDITKELKMSQTTIRSYLKIGRKNGICIEYSPKASFHNGRKVINLNDGNTFDSITKASKYYNIKDYLISKCCKRETYFGGIYITERNKSGCIMMSI